MAISRNPVSVEASRIDADSMPMNFSYPLKDFLINTFQDLGNLADKSNQAGDDAENAVNTNERQDEEITENRQGIEANTAAINTVSETLDNHVNSQQQHGANGDIVGNLDYASPTIGGVVLQAQKVSVNEIVYPDEIGAAPETYEQGYTQTLANAINATVSNQKVINSKLNDIITALTTAKIMGA
jgi:hypothetical protein